MKTALLCALISLPAFALSPLNAPALATLKEKTSKVMKACAEDKKKVKPCASYTEIAPLQACFTENKAQLSDGCKASFSAL